MHIDSQFVGTPLKKYQSRITWRDTMNYAAAIKDGNPRYFDDERKDGINAGDLFFDVLNHGGQKAISHGYVRLF